MEEALSHIKTIFYKLQSLLKKYESLQKENAREKEGVNARDEKIKILLQQNENLQQENLILKTSLQSLDEKDKKALEQKINRYIKSLDKTIALLSQ